MNVITFDIIRGFYNSNNRNFNLIAFRKSKVSSDPALQHIFSILADLDHPRCSIAFHLIRNQYISSPNIIPHDIASNDSSNNFPSMHADPHIQAGLMLNILLIYHINHAIRHLHDVNALSRRIPLPFPHISHDYIAVSNGMHLVHVVLHCMSLSVTEVPFSRFSTTREGIICISSVSFFAISSLASHRRL